MEQTNLTKTSEMLNETNQIATKWFNDANTSMMNIFKKQLNTSMDFYNNLFNSFSGLSKNNWGTSFNSPLTNSNEIMKSMFSMFNFKMDGNSSNPFSTPFDNIYKQMLDLNNNWMSSMQKEFKDRRSEWSETSEKYRGLMEEELKATRNILNSMMEAYNKQMDFSSEANKKLLQEIDGQFNSISKQSEIILADILKAAKISTEKESGAESKQAQTKKYGKVEVNQ